MLDRRGFRRSPEATCKARCRRRRSMLVTAHGISERGRARGWRGPDRPHHLPARATRRTRPLAQLAAEGRRIVVLGKRGHVEVRGIVEDHADALRRGDVAEVVRWPVAPRRRQPDHHAGGSRQALVAAIRAANAHADVRVLDTICSPTRARIEAFEHAAARRRAGGWAAATRTIRGSLVARGERHGVRAHAPRRERARAARRLVDGVQAVGLTAGTPSTAGAHDRRSAAGSCVSRRDAGRSA